MIVIVMLNPAMDQTLVLPNFVAGVTLMAAGTAGVLTAGAELYIGVR